PLPPPASPLFPYTTLFRSREARKRHAQPCPWRFVHLAVDQRDLRRPQVLLIDDAGLRHFVVQVVTFSGALPDAGEDRHTAVQLRSEEHTSELQSLAYLVCR